ncbi:MAG TPA: hypothetical protein VKK31_02710 [Thermoanaerobaculia bacterium]|nr:hypothetical protein [Thermoanaerobaculia bacterium]
MNVSRYFPLIVLLGVTAAADAQQTLPSREDPLQVFLDESGVESRYVSPVKPVSVDGRPLQFINNTGDRTFVVNIPFTYSAVELASAYATADGSRGEQIVSEIVCNALAWNQGQPCSASEREEIDTLEGLRVLLEAVMAAKPTTLTACDPLLKTPDCVVEALFWTAACRLGHLFNESRDKPRGDHLGEEARDDELLRYAHDGNSSPILERGLDVEAPKLLDRLLALQPADPVCDLATASGHQARIIGRLNISTESRPLLDPIAGEARTTGLKARFGAARVELAKRKLIETIRARMGFSSSPNVPLLGKNRKPQDLFQPELQAIFGKLESRREDLAGMERGAEDATKAILNCQLRELESAGKLLASYSPDVSVPYSGVPLSLVGPPNEHCSNMNANMMLKILAERNNEQGIEIANCTGTICSATATIPPYQRATFSPSVLGHHPTPRIAFNVSFFGDPEAPANAVGYVTRSDASITDEKPKSQFNLQLGGAASLAVEPNLNLEESETAVSGQLRHLGSSGSLSFQYTGPVEASATVQFKSGDFQDSSSKQLEASQYQVKVYGPSRTVLQYGRIPFATPSSSIAINVTGEGVQFLKDRLSVGYVVRRESETGTADKRNKDSDLWFAQFKSQPFPDGLPFLRTFDLTAVYGRDKNDVAPTADMSGQIDPPPLPPRPYWYYSGGAEVRWGIRNFQGFGGSFALYRSIRHVSGNSTDPMSARLDGAGTVGLARVGWTHLAVPKLNEPQAQVRKSFGFSGFFGFGTGNKTRTATVDDGYLGENASYSNDVLFLSKITASDSFAADLGKGLSNKRYAGLQYTDGRWSPLAFVTKALKAEKDIQSLSTVMALHAYEFDQAVQGRHWAGAEADLTFNLEAPKNIQWVLGGAYYKRSTALDRLNLDHDAWSATAKLTIKLNSL